MSIQGQVCQEIRKGEKGGARKGRSKGERERRKERELHLRSLGME